MDFQTTRWSLVLRLRRDAGEGFREAFEQLVTDYWRPVYAYIRRRGQREVDAEESTQAFFVRLLERDAFRHLEREGGAFRAYLLTSLRHFLINEAAHRKAARRHPGRPILPLSKLEDHMGSGWAADGAATPEVEFERQWAREVLRLAHDRMRADCEARGRQVAFRVFDRFVLGGQASQADLADEFGLSASQVNNYVHRGKQAYRGWIRQVLSEGVDSPEALEGEVEALREHLG